MAKNWKPSWKTGKLWRRHNMQRAADIARDRRLLTGIEIAAKIDEGFTVDEKYVARVNKRIEVNLFDRVLKKERRSRFSSEEKNPSRLLVAMLERIGLMVV